MKSIEMTVTPELAKTWLLKNTKNRRLDERRASMIADEIKAGRWILTGEAIRFSTEGALLDGQHRLRAFELSETPCRTLVQFDIPEEARFFIDTGASRTARDGLTIAGVANPKWMSGAARALCMFDGSAALKTVGRFTAGRALAVAELWGADRMQRNIVALLGAPPAVRSTALMACAIAIDAAHGPSASYELSEVMVRGVGSPALLLIREALLRGSNSNGDKWIMAIGERVASGFAIHRSGIERSFVKGSASALRALMTAARSNIASTQDSAREAAQ